jgi:hypothetical protein
MLRLGSPWNLRSVRSTISAGSNARRSANNISKFGFERIELRASKRPFLKIELFQRTRYQHFAESLGNLVLTLHRASGRIQP